MDSLSFGLYFPRLAKNSVSKLTVVKATTIYTITHNLFFLLQQIVGNRSRYFIFDGN